MAEITDSLDRLQISIDGLASIGESISSALASTIGGFNSTFDAVAENLTNQIEHLAAVTEAVGSNLTTLISELVSGASSIAGGSPGIAGGQAGQTPATGTPGQTPTATTPDIYSVVEDTYKLVDDLAKNPPPPSPQSSSLPTLNALPTAPALSALPANLPTATAAGEAGSPAGGLDVAGMFGGLKDSLAGLSTMASQVGSRFGGLTAPLTVVGGAMSGLAKVGGETFAALRPAGVAVGAATQAFERIVGVMAQFAEAASPATMGEFNRSMKDLQATIGTAFVPFFSALTSITRQVAGELFPAMQALQPAFSALAGIVGAILVPVANVFGSVIQSLTPFMKLLDLAVQLWSAFNPVTILLQGLVTVLGGVTQVFSALMAVLDPIFEVMQAVADEFRAIGTLLSSLFSAAVKTAVDMLLALIPKLDLSDVLTTVHNAFITVAKSVIQFALQVASLFGNTDFKKNLIASLEAARGGQKPYVTAAPQNVSTNGLESIGKQMSVAAASAIGAGGTPAKKDTTDLVGELLAEVKAANGQQASGFDDLKKQFVDVVTDLPSKLAEKVLKVNVVEIVKEYLRGLDSLPNTKSLLPSEIGWRAGKAIRSIAGG